MNERKGEREKRLKVYVSGKERMKQAMIIIHSLFRLSKRYSRFFFLSLRFLRGLRNWRDDDTKILKLARRLFTMKLVRSFLFLPLSRRKSGIKDLCWNIRNKERKEGWKVKSFFYLPPISPFLHFRLFKLRSNPS